MPLPSPAAKPVSKPAASISPALAVPATPAKKKSKLSTLQLTEQTQLTLVLIIALGCGLVASVAAFQFLRAKERAMTASAPAPQVTRVVVARQDLSTGTVLGPASVEIVEWPSDNPPHNGFALADDVVGRNVRTAIYRGEPIVESRLVPKGERGGLFVRIPQGMLAMSIKVDPEIGVSGFIQPGSHVDVVATVKLQNGQSMSKLVLQNILVLAVEHDIENDDDKPRDATTVTIALTPGEAEKLALARSEGQVMLALRNMRDEDTYETPGFSVQELAKRSGLSGSTESYAQPPDSVESVAPAKQAEHAEMAEDLPPLPKKASHVIQLIEAETTSEVRF